MFNQHHDEVILVDQAQNILERLKLQLDTKSALGRLAEWLTSHTKFDPEKYFSFKDHEMQIQIVNDISSRVAVQKCSQVGLSECSSRKAIGITAISKNKNVIYGGPTLTWTRKFSTTRMRPVIDNSPLLADGLNRNAKGSELIGLNSSFIHMAGMSGSDIISIPAEDIFVDELDFCDPRIVGTAESRVKHAKEDQYGFKGRINYFSTPTVEGYGINAKFKDSTQNHYQCHCSSCDEWFEPNYFDHIRIPNFDKPIKELTPEDVLSDDYDIRGSYMECPNCGVDVWDDLCNPSRRKWVARYPTAKISGYQVFPWDVPKINSIPSILMQMTGYENIADYYNYTVGLPYTDKNNSFLISILTNGIHSDWVEKKFDNDNSRYSVGVDVGKSSHISVTKKDMSGKYHVVYLEKYKASKDKLLGERVVEICKSFKARACIIDGAPDFSTAQYVSKKLPRTEVYACEYIKNKPKGKMTNLIFKEDENVVSAYRTGVLKTYLDLHNDGDVLYPNSQHSEKIKVCIAEVGNNIGNLKRIHKLDAEGENVDMFIKTGADHYGHSISYSLIGHERIANYLSSSEHIPAPTTVTSFSNDTKRNIGRPVGGGVISTSPMSRQGRERNWR